MTVVDLDSSPFSDDQFCSHREVVPCLVFLRKVEVGMSASLDPHVKSGVVAPSLPHDLACGQVLLSLTFVDVEHEEEDFLWHLGDH
jgi:hypothetical protein